MFMKLKRLGSSLVVAAALIALPAIGLAAEPENTMVISLKDGDVTIALRPDLAPQHVERIKTLVREGAYDNVAFHRVIEGFMAQTGDVEFGNLESGYSAELSGTGGSKLPDLPAEFSGESFARGVVGMARRGDSEDSANSQFFIMFAPKSELDGDYTVIGVVESGMEAVDKIKRGDPRYGVVSGPDRMIKVRIAGDGN